MNSLSLHDLHKAFGETRALDGVSFEAGEGEIVAVLGPSGCGKSTLLSVIAGLEIADEGEVRWDGKSLAGVPPHKRGFGLMFQDFALFPHMDVFDNVAFGLRMAELSKEMIGERVGETLELVGLPDFGGREVSTLSGGEQQRVALARSLAPQPRLLMLDEPLGSLDRRLRERLLTELQNILHKITQTVIYVTHDQEEALAVADRVVVMNAGRVAQMGTPEAIYRRPASVFVARFLGLDNLLSGEARQVGGQYVAATAVGDLPLPEAAQGRVTVLLRPEGARLDVQGDFQITGVVKERSFRGNAFRVGVEAGGVQLRFDFPASAAVPEAGEKIKLGFDFQEAVQVIEGDL